MNLFPKKILGLDFHDYFAQAVELKTAGKDVSLNSFSRVPIPPKVIQDGEIRDKVELKKILTTFLETANPAPIKTTKVVCSFPSKKVFTHTFTFPAALNYKELKKAIPFEAETVIPFSMSDIYWDFTVIHKDNPSEQHATQKVLLACIPKETADSYVDLLESMGLEPFAFTIPAECAKYGLKNQLSSAQSSLVIDVGSLVTSYSLFEGKELIDTYTSLKGGRSLISELAKNCQSSEASILEQKERDCLDKVYWPEIETFNRTVLADGIEFIGKKKISDVFLTGEFLNLPDLQETAKKFYPAQKISFGDPRLGVRIDSDKFLPLDK
jgi:type IV pilus assembly protein PilM